MILIIAVVGFITNLCSATGPCVLVDPSAESLCVTLEAINRAFQSARATVGLIEPYPFPEHQVHHHHHEVDKLGLVLTETTRILAHEYKLNHHQIYYLMPKLDVALTEIWKFCPSQFQHKVCELTRYRSLSGHCNNVNHPDWGAAFVPFQSILPPHRPDGVSEPKDFEEGQLPSARVVSAHMHRDAVVHDHSITVMLIAWGQIIDHDITLTAETKDENTHKDPDCCTDLYGAQSHHNCFPIQIPSNDPFYAHYGQHCMSFTRSFAGVRSECRLGPRTAFNTISSYLDANFVYGSNKELGAELRSGKYGMLKSFPVFEDYGLKDLLPPKINEPDDGCTRSNTDVFCFLAGDERVNEQLVLTVLHTLFMREHNRIALTLAKINPHWEDEKIFQETRHIVIAMVQHITFEEFLPMVLGKDVMHQYDISVQKEDYWTGYDPKLNPTAAEEFITSAFRFGHSLLPQKIERWSHGNRYIASEHLSNLIRQPYDLYRPGYVDTFIMGLVNQLAQSMDEGVTEQVTTLLFKEPHKHYGLDLAAMNIQRGRDHGVPGYTAYREICGLSPIAYWDDLIGVMRNETVYRYKSIYKSPHDIDLWSGGVSELPAEGSLLGPTFGCIIATQFHAIRAGDRFWYELPDLPSSFTPEQLYEIRKVKLSRMLCDNSDSVKSIQIYAMSYPDSNINPRVPCEGLILPRIDLEKWRETAQYPEHEHEYHNDHFSHSNIVYDSSKNYNDHSQIGKNKEVHTYDYNALHPPDFDPSFITPQQHKEIEYQYEPETYPLHENMSYAYHKTPHTQPQHYLTHHSKYVNHSFKNAQTAQHAPSQLTHVRNRKTKGRSHHNRNNSYKPQNVPKYHEHESENYESSTQDTVSEEVNSVSLEKQAPPSAPIKIIVAKSKRPSYHRVQSLPRIKPFPESPFPGMDGLFSPNPGYLVRQKFTIYKAPVPVYHSPPPQNNFWHAVMG